MAKRDGSKKEETRTEGYFEEPQKQDFWCEITSFLKPILLHTYSKLCLPTTRTYKVTLFGDCVEIWVPFIVFCGMCLSSETSYSLIVFGSHDLSRSPLIIS